MRAPLVVIGKITAEDLHEMMLVENNDVIQTLSSNATDDAFNIGVLPGTPRCDGTLFHSQTANPLSKVLFIDGIAIAKRGVLTLKSKSGTERPHQEKDHERRYRINRARAWLCNQNSST